MDMTRLGTEWGGVTKRPSFSNVTSPVVLTNYLDVSPASSAISFSLGLAGPTPSTPCLTESQRALEHPIERLCTAEKSGGEGQLRLFLLFCF